MPDPNIEDDAHNATITGVEYTKRDNGKISFLINISSRDEKMTVALDIPVPPLWEMNLNQGTEFDPLTLPEDGENDNQQTMFRRGIANRKLDAWLQRLVFNRDSLARKAGRDPKLLNIILKPQNIDDYVHNLCEMLSGVECLLLRRGGDVWQIMDAGKYELDDKRLKGYRIAWEIV